ncbi:MAG: sensor histidine kinase [Lawsonibacter sp.]|jgi:signal transduction histidine kinase
MIRNLRFKFVFINMSIVTLMLCVIFGLVYSFTKANLEMENINMMQSIAEQPFQLGVPNERDESVRLPFFTLQLGPYGDLIATGGGYYDLSDHAFLDALIEAASSSPRPLGVLPEYNLRYYRVDTPLRKCLVFSDISSEVSTLDNLIKTCAFLGGVSFFVFLGVSILLSKWAVKPVALAWKEQRQFIAAASHELKTPLSVIMTNAELMQNPDYGPEKQRKFLESILTMSHQMRRLIEQMLELARADSAQIQTPHTPLDFSYLAEQVALTFEPIFFEKNLPFTVQIEKNIQVSGNTAQLEQLLEILLDNAQKYAHPAGATFLTLKRKGKSHCLLSVCDQGDPIPPEELQNIFKRFYRMDPARSRTGSFGLGLSIAQSITAQLRGKIWAESRQGLNSFFVELPMLG